MPSRELRCNRERGNTLPSLRPCRDSEPKRCLGSIRTRPLHHSLADFPCRRPQLDTHSNPIRIRSSQGNDGYQSLEHPAEKHSSWHINSTVQPLASEPRRRNSESALCSFLFLHTTTYGLTVSTRCTRERKATTSVSKCLCF